jgi:hypothetical protein
MKPEESEINEELDALETAALHAALDAALAELMANLNIKDTKQ